MAPWNVIRTRRASFLDYFRYLNGGNPCDEWEFDIDHHRCKLINEWRGGATLLVDGVVVDRNDQRIEVSGRDPVLSATVADRLGEYRKVEVFVRAVFSVKACVHIDGRPIVNGFV